MAWQRQGFWQDSDPWCILFSESVSRDAFERVMWFVLCVGPLPIQGSPSNGSQCLNPDVLDLDLHPSGDPASPPVCLCVHVALVSFSFFSFLQYVWKVLKFCLLYPVETRLCGPVCVVATGNCLTSSQIYSSYVFTIWNFRHPDCSNSKFTMLLTIMYTQHLSQVFLSWQRDPSSAAYLEVSSIF